MKKILYFDMDNVLVDFKSGIDQLDVKIKSTYDGRLDEVPSIFKLMKPMDGAIDAVHKLSKVYDVYILSTSPWLNPTALQDKLDWIKKYFGDDRDSVFYKKVVFSHKKNLLKGDYLIDDRTKNGAAQFEGKLFQFGSADYPNWKSILDALL
jgi:5'(3')-deoxyribonucleotidase